MVHTVVRVRVGSNPSAPAAVLEFPWDKVTRGCVEVVTVGALAPAAPASAGKDGEAGDPADEEEVTTTRGGVEVEVGLAASVFGGGWAPSSPFGSRQWASFGV